MPFRRPHESYVSLDQTFHFKGFLITIICTQLNPSPNPSHYPEFNFEYIDGISPAELSYNSFGGDVMLYLLVLNNECKTPFRDCLWKLQLNAGSFGPVSCVVYDAVMYFSAAIADEVEIQRIVLRTSSVTAFLTLVVDANQSDLTNKEHHPEQPLVQFPFLRAKDMPVFNTSDDKAAKEVLARIHHGTKTASAVIWDSLHCLEQAMFNKAQEKIVSPIYPICPSLHCNNKTKELLI